MVVVPAVSGVTSPVVASTVATVVAELSYVTASPVGVMVSVGSVKSAPTVASAAVGLKAIVTSVLYTGT